MPNNYDTEDMQILADAAIIIGSLHGRLANLPGTPNPGSDLAGDELATPALVHPAQSATLMMANVSNCLMGAFHLLNPQNASGATSIEVLLRTALIGTSRTAFILAPDAPEVRRANATRVAHSDFHSGSRAWKVLGQFEHIIENASQAQSLFSEFRQEFPARGPGGEEQLINDMLATIEPYLRTSEDQPVLREQMLLMWHGYSAVAHANTWQLSLSQSLNEGSGAVTVGSLHTNLAILANAADFSLKLLDQRSRAPLS